MLARCNRGCLVDQWIADQPAGAANFLPPDPTEVLKQLNGRVTAWPSAKAGRTTVEYVALRGSVVVLKPSVQCPCVAPHLRFVNEVQNTLALAKVPSRDLNGVSHGHRHERADRWRFGTRRVGDLSAGLFLLAAPVGQSRLEALTIDAARLTHLSRSVSAIALAAASLGFAVAGNGS